MVLYAQAIGTCTPICFLAPALHPSTNFASAAYGTLVQKNIQATPGSISLLGDVLPVCWMFISVVDQIPSDVRVEAFWAEAHLDFLVGLSRGYIISDFG